MGKDAKKPSQTAASNSKCAASKAPTEDRLLKKFEHHTSMAQKHRAHADLIEAKLRVNGKRIAHVYPGESTHPTPSSAKIKRKIVEDT